MKPTKADMLIALGPLKPKKKMDSEPDMGDADEAAEGEEPSGDDMKRQAADDAFDALKADDRDLFADALGRYVQACM